MDSKHGKRLLAILTAVTLCVSALTGCGAKDTAQNPTDAPTLLSAEDSGDIVATVAGEEITVADLQYYIYNVAMMQLYQIDPELTGDIGKVDWNQKQESGKTLEETVLDGALDEAIDDVIMIQKGKEQGILFGDEAAEEMRSTIDEFIAQSGEESFLLNLTAMGINSREQYEKIYERMTLAQQIETDIQQDISKYIQDPEVLKGYKSEDKATVQQILIMSDSEKYENPEETAKEVLAMAKSGSDFVQLMEAYNEDPGATEAGYTFGPGEMVEPFEKASFALDYDEISDLVTSEYGYHIIKRMIGSAELQNYWKANTDMKKQEKVLRKISVADIMQAISNAENTLQEQSRSSEASATPAG